MSQWLQPLGNFIKFNANAPFKESKVAIGVIARKYKVKMIGAWG